MLMSPNKGETAVQDCHCPGDMVVGMRKVLAIPRSYFTVMDGSEAEGDFVLIQIFFALLWKLFLKNTV